MQGGFIKYLVIILAILAVVFLSQAVYFKNYGKQVSEVANRFMAKASNWAMSKIYPQITQEVQKRGEMVSEQVTEEKEKITQSIGEKIKNYFTGISDAILHPDFDSSPTSESANPQNNRPAVPACNCPACPNVPPPPE